MNPLLVYWWLLATVLFVSATAIWWVWWQVRGLRGAALGVIATALAVIATCMSIILSDDAIVSTRAASVMIRVLIGPIALAVFVLSDTYAANHNDHRSLTTKGYMWFKSLRKEKDSL